MLFRDRHDAGRQLATRLGHLAGSDVVVLGLPRGGVPVAAEVAAALAAPLDVIIVRKLGVPGHRELAMGAIGEGGIRVVDEGVMAATGASDHDLAAAEERERAELERRAERLRGRRPRRSIEGHVAVIVDDGIATGSTALAAVQVARSAGSARVVIAVPVAPPDWEKRFVGLADEAIAVATPRGFMAVGQFYDDFDQVPDDQVADILDHANEPPNPSDG